jgi:branched-chain amino acid transport system ATP-binding protein
MMFEVRNLHTGYEKLEVVKGVSLEVERGQIVAIIGSNGAGKTTLFKAILGILSAWQGGVLFEDEDFTRYSPVLRIKRGISLVPQGRNVFPYLTVLENLHLGAYIRNGRKEIQEGIENAYGMFPILKERKNQKAGTLSGGEQQMLFIARALMSRPKFLMLDEPSLGIAPFLIKEIFRTIKMINEEQKTTIFLVEQNAPIALRVAERGYVMEGGQIHMSGSTRELLDDDRVKGAYLGKKD